MTAPERRVRSRLLDVAFVVVLLVIAAIPLWPIYEHSAICWLVGVGVGAGTAVAIVGARWPAYAVIGLTIIAYALIGVPLAVPTQAFGLVLPTGAGLRTLALGTVGAWQQMLTARVPFGTYEALLVPALVVVLLATVLGVSLALRAKKAGWAIIAPLAVLTFAIAFGSAETLWPAWTGVGLVVVALAWATMRADPIRSPRAFTASGQTRGERRAGGPGGAGRRLARSTVQRYAAALVLVAVCATGAVAVDRTWPSGAHRDVLREDVIPPMDVRDLLSPLVGYRSRVLPPGDEKVLFTIDGLPDGVRVRLATLDTYNGMVFAVGTDESSGTFERVPYRIDRDSGTRAHVTVRIDTLDGPWLPTVGDLAAVTFTSDPDRADQFYYNDAAAAGALLGGLTPTTYTLDARARTMPALESLATAKPGPAVQTPVDPVPEAIADAALDHAPGKSPGERLVALVKWLRTGYVSHSGADEPFSRSGHSAERLGILLTQSPMVGDAEQYATAMALLAREVGFPSRVVVGYAPAPGQSQITGADTTAWVEVQVADGTWVGLDPNPEPRPVPTEDDPTPEYVAHPQSVLPPPPPSNDEPVTTQNDDGEHEDPDPGPGWIAVLLAILRGVGMGTGVLALLTLPIWGLALVAWVRRRRRRRRDRQETVVTGAWNEVRDAMIDRGYDVQPAATRQEIAALARSTVIYTLAEHADRGVFSENGFTSADVRSYWSQVRDARRSLDAGTTRWSRIRRIVTLKSARSLRRSWQSWRHGQRRGES